MQITKWIPTLTVGANLGVAQIQLALGAEIERVGRLGEIELASRIGHSPINVERNLGLVGSIHGLDLENKMTAVSVPEVIRKLEEVRFQVGVIVDGDESRQWESNLGDFHSRDAMLASLFLCISYAIGDRSAVRCLKKFLMKLCKEKRGEGTVDGAWLETFLERFRKCLDLGGPISKLEGAVVDYDKKFHQGRPWNEGYRGVVEKVVEVLLDKLAQTNDDTGISPEMWWTRSRKVHKLAYLLCFMGWNVEVETDLRPLKPLNTNLVVQFTDQNLDENERVSRKFIEEKLNMAGVGAPHRTQPSFEDEQGPGVLVPTKEGLVFFVRAVLQEEKTEGRAIEDAWYLGLQIGEKCKVELVFGKTECSYRFGESTFETVTGDGGGAGDLLHEIDRSLKKYSFVLHKIVRGSGRMEYENLINRLKNTFKDPNVPLFPKGTSRKDEHDKLRLVVAFYFGLVYGKLEALLVATGLKHGDGSWVPTQKPLEFRIGWMDYMDKFVYDVHRKMWELSTTNLLSPSMHSVFSFVGMCCTSKSLYFGKLAQLEDIVGFWTGSSLLMLAIALNPGNDPMEGAKLVNYPVWFVNLSTSDGVHVQSSKWIEREEYIKNMSTAGGSDEFKHGFEDPPQQPLKIFLCPNYMEENAKVIHSMMCQGDIVYIAPVMGALVNLHKKTVGCSFRKNPGCCDGTAKRTLNCRGALPIYSGSLKLGKRDYHGISGDREEMPEEAGVMMTRGDIPWRFAGACIYHDTNFVIAESCLSCAREGKVDQKWAEYII